MRSLLPLTIALAFGFDLARLARAQGQETPAPEQNYEREELGVNEYTAPSISRIFQQLDDLKPFSFDRMQRPTSQPTHASREQIGLIFGALVAEGFLIVACEKKDLVDDVGRALLHQARSLGVAEHVMRHSASLTDLGRHGDWPTVRKELAATQADVEQAMVELRDQEMAHLISLGGWLRGLEIGSAAVDADFSVERARVLSQPDLVKYFSEELKTLPPPVASTPLFAKIRAGVRTIRDLTDNAPASGLSPADVKKIHAEARELNLTIQRAD